VFDRSAEKLIAKKKTYSEAIRELDNQKNKKTVKLGIDGKTYIIKNPYHMDATELQFKLADKLYDFMREKDTDISDIAANLGFKADNIKKCKDHIF